MFKQPLWIISLGNLLGIAGVILGLCLVISGTVAWQWLLLWPVMHIWCSLGLSVGLHRYFAHGSFVTTPFWHKALAYTSIFLLNGSPFGWATAHITHHVYSDTEGDPHYVKTWYAFWKRYKSVKMVKRRLRHIIGDETLAFVHRYGGLIWVIGCVVLLGVSWKLFLFGYLMALGSTHMIGSSHQLLSHANGEPRNLPWMEFILPACGEWHHKTHHDHSGRSDLRTKWWHADIGAKFINIIKI